MRNIYPENIQNSKHWLFAKKKIWCKDSNMVPRVQDTQ